jgi:hypothetical protein
MPKFLNDVSVYAPYLTLESDASNITPKLTIRDTTNAAASAPIIEFNKNSATENSEQLGNIRWRSLSSLGGDEVYASIEGEIVSNTNNAELGQLTCFISSSNSTNPAGLILAGHAGTDSRVDATIGNTTDSVTTVAGNLTLSGDTITSAADLNIVATGNDVTVDTDTFKIESSTALAPVLELLSTANSIYGSVLKFNKQQADNTPADSDAIGWISFAGEDVAGAENFYGSIICTTVEVDAGDEAGQIQISVSNDGVSRNGITMTGDKDTAQEVDVTIANGAASTTTIAGNLAVTTVLTASNAVLVTPQLGTPHSGNLSNCHGINYYEHLQTAGTTAGETGYGAEIVKFGTGSVVAGKIYQYSGGAWAYADADAESTSSKLLGVALDSGVASAVGMCVRGMVTLATSTTGSDGDVLWLKPTSAGNADDAAPTGNTHIARVIGYCLNADGKRIFFNPDNTFVEVVA